MKKKLILLPVLVFLLISTATSLPASANAATPAYVQLTFNNGGTLSLGANDNALIKNGVSYMNISIVTTAGLDIRWDSSRKRVEFYGWEKSFAVRIGNRTGVLDGSTIDIGGTPFLYNNELYVPTRFLVKALEGNSIRWDSKTRTIVATGLHLYRGYSETFEGAVYSASLDTGDLYVSFEKGAKHKIGNLGTRLDLIDFNFERTPDGLLILRVINNYGEPHINTEYFTFLFKNGSVIRQAHTDFRSTFLEPAVWSEGKLLLNDGRTLRLIDDGTGRVSEVIDLANLMGIDGSKNTYSNVEGFYTDIALIRPWDTGLLTLVNRATGKLTLLYQQFFNADRQKELEKTDAMFPGDSLRFAGRSDNKLTFTYSNGQEIVKFTHTLSALQQ